MATQVEAFTGIEPRIQETIDEANARLAEIEASGGKFIESHWSALGPSNGEPFGTVALVVVYEAGTSVEEVAEGNAALDAYYRNEGLSSTGESQE